MSAHEYTAKPTAAKPELNLEKPLSADGNPDDKNHDSEARRGSAKIEHQYHAIDPPVPPAKFPWKKKSWPTRTRSPGLKWYKDYSKVDVREGRVLVIDYVKWDHSKQGTRKVAAQEIYDMTCLKKVCQDSREEEAVLRVFHVQNAPWAVRFLLHKFNISAESDLVGTDFGKYLKASKRQKTRGGKPFLSGKTWKTQHDPWRGISKTAFGVDYMKCYPTRNPLRDASRSLGLEAKFMELNCYDDDDNPAYGYDVHVQRVSCYVQHKELNTDIPDQIDIENPYKQDGPRSPHQRYSPSVENFDNGNAILIFDDSQSGSLNDSLIAPRDEWESRWRRLPFYLAYEQTDVTSDDAMALNCMQMVTEDIWKSLAQSWKHYFDHCGQHVTILEDKIYEQSADESRAPELWLNSSLWLKIERLMLIHINVIKECQTNFKDMTDDEDVSDRWLEDSPEIYQRLSDVVQEDLVKPTANLADLMYKSVGIRDTRHSLQLSMSMWRLSWITFIFLPLTFIVGFFGMNVSIFNGAGFPDIKWYFISAVPLMLLVLVSWYMLKHYLNQSRQTPYSRGIYEHLFHELAVKYPVLWSRAGPRTYVEPKSRMDRWKWWLILRWSDPDKTIRASTTEDDSFDGLGAWSRAKRYLLKRWTDELSVMNRISVSTTTLGDSAGGGAVAEGVGGVTEMLTMGGTAGAAALADGMLRVPYDINQRLSVISAVSGKSIGTPRPSTRASRTSGGGRDSAVMVEEEPQNWLEILGQRSSTV